MVPLHKVGWIWIRIQEGKNYHNVLHTDDDCIGPCRVQQRRRSRAHHKQQGIPGSTYPDHEVRPWKYPITPLERQVTGTWVPLTPSPLLPPIRAAWVETHYPPPQGIPLPQENYHLGPASVKTSLRPPNLDHRSHFWHKMTARSISV